MLPVTFVRVYGMSQTVLGNDMEVKSTAERRIKKQLWVRKWNWRGVLTFSH